MQGDMICREVRVPLKKSRPGATPIIAAGAASSLGRAPMQITTSVLVDLGSERALCDPPESSECKAESSRNCDPRLHSWPEC